MENQPPVPAGSTIEASKENEEKKPVETPNYLEELKAKDERIQKLQEEKDNYRKMGLKWKKAAEDGEETPVFDEERLRQIAREELMNSEIAQANADKDEFIRKLAKENTEMKVAIANKSQISNMPGGGSQPNDNVVVEKLTEEQKAELTVKAREVGMDPAIFIKKAEENLEKAKNK